MYIRNIERYSNLGLLADRMALSVRISPMLPPPQLEWGAGIAFQLMIHPPYEQTPFGVCEAIVRYAPLEDYMSSVKTGNLEIPIHKCLSAPDLEFAEYLSNRKVDV